MQSEFLLRDSFPPAAELPVSEGKLLSCETGKWNLLWLIWDLLPKGNSQTLSWCDMEMTSVLHSTHTVCVWSKWTPVAQIHPSQFVLCGKQVLTQGLFVVKPHLLWLRRKCKGSGWSDISMAVASKPSEHYPFIAGLAWSEWSSGDVCRWGRLVILFYLSYVYQKAGKEGSGSCSTCTP